VIGNRISTSARVAALAVWIILWARRRRQRVSPVHGSRVGAATTAHDEVKRSETRREEGDRYETGGTRPRAAIRGRHDMRHSGGIFRGAAQSAASSHSTQGDPLSGAPAGGVIAIYLNRGIA
jgi:hypothetical protein